MNKLIIFLFVVVVGLVTLDIFVWREDKKTEGQFFLLTKKGKERAFVIEHGARLYCHLYIGNEDEHEQIIRSYGLSFPQYTLAKDELGNNYAVREDLHLFQDCDAVEKSIARLKQQGVITQ